MDADEAVRRSAEVPKSTEDSLITTLCLSFLNSKMEIIVSNSQVYCEDTIAYPLQSKTAVPDTFISQ